ncbi:MAG: hypothetical protein WBI06_08780 [Paludibacter sp.]
MTKIEPYRLGMPEFRLLHLFDGIGITIFGCYRWFRCPVFLSFRHFIECLVAQLNRIR